MKTQCPYCNYKATGHTTIHNEENPIEDDVSFCIGCGEVSIFQGKTLIKIDVKTLEKDVRNELNDIRVAWLKVRAVDSSKGKK